MIIMSNPAKTEKPHGRITLEQEINLFKFPTLPRQRSNSPLPGHDAQSNARGMRGGMLKLQFDRHIMKRSRKDLTLGQLGQYRN